MHNTTEVYSKTADLRVPSAQQILLVAQEQHRFVLLRGETLPKAQNPALHYP